LFSNDYETESFKALGFYAYDDFYDFGLKIGMLENRVKHLLDKYRTENNKTLLLGHHSFLTQSIKELYIAHYRSRLKMLNTSFSKKI
jgi:serine/threonine-protein kinase HipA